MSYDSPAPEVETVVPPKENEPDSAPTPPDEVDPASGTDTDGVPVENPAG